MADSEGADGPKGAAVATSSSLLAQLPAVHALVDRAAAHSAAPRWALVEAARQTVAHKRAQLLAGAASSGDRNGNNGGSSGAADSAAPSASIAAEDVARLAEQLARPSLRRVINATGVVLHTNLGRAPLAAAARRAVDEVAAGYTNLEYDLAAGARGSRHDHLRELLRQLTGAEDAVVVNNNAAATVLGLAALAGGRGVVVSRGEQIEIGGSFRLPEILALSGCRMLEVGTTNKTHLADYRAAAAGADDDRADDGDRADRARDVALLLKVHRSNFAIVGFTAEVAAAELVALAAELTQQRRAATSSPTAAGPPLAVMVDLGSGALLSAELQRAAGLPVEPTVAETVASGADLVSFSGDKLLGGPQAGILVGKAAAIARARKHPLMRMLRPDKLTLAALGATLACYRDHQLDELPALAMLRRPAALVRGDAERVANALSDACRPGTGLSLEVHPCTATVGGGAMPTAALPSWAVVLSHPRHRATALDARLRNPSCATALPILGRIEDDRLWLDLRTVPAAELLDLITALAALTALP